VFLTLDLPEPLVNVVYLGFEVDFRWPAQRVAVEVDGPHHGRAYDRHADIARDKALVADGYTVLRFSADDVQQRGPAVARRVRDTLDQ
jgi:very-short-patch-repair endonuclease